MNGIILKGDNLGERHRFFNHLVNEHCNEEKSFDTLSEATPIDKLFKIDVANHLKYVEYIIQTLKEDDMLYVCRALKSHWLLDLEYCNIITPVYLESKLFPDMQRPAVNKVKHWIEANIKNHKQCEEFYAYYRNNFEESIKYLKNCSPPFILKEVENIVDKITPKQLKMLCEVCPNVSKIYFECMLKNDNAIMKYTRNKSKFFSSLKCILKLDGNLYLELIETYDSQDRLSPSATLYIMKYLKKNYLAKCELYTTQILNVNTLASCLTPNECRDLVLHLAKAEYLANWFSYQSVQPFIKRLPLEERASFKKLVFIDKAVGEKVKEWPYDKPIHPQIINTKNHIFVDEEHNNYEYDYYDDVECPRMLKSCKRLIKRKYSRYCAAAMDCIIKKKTLLDQLFDRYRFAGFSKTYMELKNRLQAESTIEGRQNIFLVLISKSGGIPEHVDVLMKLLIEKHKNEPSNLRAAVVRSFVKRLSFWRMPEEIWTMMIEFAHGLGLDGHEGNPLCLEGLHAVILRNILNGISPTSNLMKAYLKNFTTFKDYSLKGSEIGLVKKYLPSLLTESPKEFLDVISTYNIKDIADVVDSVARSAHGNEDLINYLFEKRIARRQLIADTFPLKQFEASYINALRHNASLLGDGEAFASLALKENTNHIRFLRNLKIFFGEATGLADKHLMTLSNAFRITPKSTLVRPIAMLSSGDTILKKIEDLVDTKSKVNLKLAAVFKDNIHLCKPIMNIYKFDWRKLGSKAVANKILINKICSLEHNLKSCLKFRGLYASALRLALNTSFEVDTFTFVAARRPKVAVNVATSYYFNGCRTIQPEIWKIVKEIILKFDYQNLPRRTLRYIKNNNNIPKNIEADYWATVYQALMNVKRSKAMRALSRLENMLYKVDKEILRKLVHDFIENDITVENLTNYENLEIWGIDLEKSTDIISNEYMCMYMRFVAKYLLLTTSDEEQREKIENTLYPLFDRIETIWKHMDDKSYIVNCLVDFLKALKYTPVFIDSQYVPCMPVFTKVISRLSSVMLRKEYFYQYTKIHFTILYYNAIKYALEQNPSCFNGEDKSQVMSTVGTKFGEYVGHDITELVKEYFFSIIQIYNEGLKDFLTEYFPYTECRFNFFAMVTRGILKYDTLEAYLVAEYLYKEYKNSWTKLNAEDILEILQSCKYVELKFFLGDTNVSDVDFYY